MTGIPWLGARTPFPPVAGASPEGIVAAGGDLSPARLLAAYRQGIFPWYEEGGPIVWWSPDPRFILFLDEFHLSRRDARELRRRRFRITLDTAFARLIGLCREVHGTAGGTWITPEMARAYGELHRRGVAHSVEAWDGATLAGGLYGVSLGHCFFGESMVSAVSGASKAAVSALVPLLRTWGLAWMDCQVQTTYLASLGAREIPRRLFLQLLQAGLGQPGIEGSWTGRYRSPAPG